MKIVIDPFDKKSIDAALKAVQQYKRDFEAKEQEFVRRLAEIGVRVAQVGYAVADYDGVKDVVVSMEKTAQGYTVVASGETVGFIEFGTGVKYPEWDNTGMEYKPPAHGTYGKGQGASAWVFLLASPICPKVGVSAVQHSVGLVFPNPYGDPKIHRAMSNSGSVTLTKKVWKYIPWIPNLWDLLTEARKTKQLLPKLQTKTIVFQSKFDELVSRRSESHLKQCPNAKITVLANSTHFYYTGPEIRMVQQAFLDACREVDV